MNKIKQGFTLVELIVVITILAILGTIGFLSLIGFQKIARESARISDLNTIAKTLELFKTQENYYPAPTDSFTITFSGSTAWNQGVFGVDTQQLTRRVSKIPKDPLTDNEYAYSTINTGQEYELGAISESLLSQTFSDSLFLNQAYAANTYYTNIKGNYNKQIVTVRESDKIYILGVPTIITSEIESVTVQNIISNGSFALRNSQNLPGSYSGKLSENQTVQDTSSSFVAGALTDTSIPVIYEGTIEALSDDSEKQKFANNLVSYYQESNLTEKNNPGLEALLDSNVTTSSNSLSYVNTLIKSNTGGIPGDKIVVNTVASSTGPIVKTGEAAKFISVWDTEGMGISDDDQIILPLHNSGNYNFTVDWESDGIIDDTITSYDQAEVTHTYSSPGIYTVTIDGQIEGFSFADPESVLSFNYNSIYSYVKELLLPQASAVSDVSFDAGKLTDVLNWGNVKLANTGYQFDTTISLGNISATDELYLDNLTNLEWMFRGSSLLSANFGYWDFSTINNMSGMFQGAYNFNQDIGGWDVSNVTDMSIMFDSAYSFNQDIGGWDVSNVANMSRMFAYDPLFYVNATFNQDIGGWDVSNVTDMSKMFACVDFDQDIGGWDVSNVTNMSEMFACRSYVDNAIFNQDIGGWDVSNVTDMSKMFNKNIVFNQDLSSWCVSALSSEPSNFSDNASSWVLSKPVWGTCTGS